MADLNLAAKEFIPSWLVKKPAAATATPSAAIPSPSVPAAAPSTVPAPAAGVSAAPVAPATTTAVSAPAAVPAVATGAASSQGLSASAAAFDPRALMAKRAAAAATPPAVVPASTVMWPVKAKQQLEEQHRGGGGAAASAAAAAAAASASAIGIVPPATTLPASVFTVAAAAAAAASAGRGGISVPPRSPPVAAHADPEVLSVVARNVAAKSDAEVLEISSKSTFQLTAHTFVPQGYSHNNNNSVRLSSKVSPLALRPLPTALPLLLHDNWHFYFIDRLASKAEDYEPLLVFRIDSIATFWQVFNNIPEATEMPPGASYCLFRADVAPRWEDARNKEGGSWQMGFKGHDRKDREVLDEVWTRLCCRIIGESWKPEHRECVNGIVLKSREKRFVLQIWVSEERENFPTDILDGVEEVLPAFDIDYIPHDKVRAFSESTPSKGGKRKDKVGNGKVPR